MTRTVPGYRLAFQPEDGQSLLQVAAQAPTKLAADPAVAAVLGTYNSSSAQSAAPILAQRSIVQVSPANIGPALTRGENAATDRRRPFLSYFQVAANDLVQGQIGARHLVQKAGKKRIAVIDHGKTYGVGLVGNFVAEAERLVAREKVGEKDTDFSSPIAAIRSSRPDAVYYGGEYPAAGPLARQVAEAGLDIPLMGGDSIADPQYIELGGRSGDLATTIGAAVDSLSSARAFVDAYADADYPEPASAYGGDDLRRDQRDHRGAGFWNVMRLVAQKLGVDLDPIAATVARSAEGSINPEYGIRGGAPYGGVCLPKDTEGFLGSAKNIDVDMPLPAAVVEIDDRLAAIVNHEVEAAAHAATGQLRGPAGEARVVVGSSQERESA